MCFESRESGPRLPLAANPFGLSDLYGNVAELCSDWYQENAYESSSAEDPRGPELPAARRVVRGGCYINPHEHHTSASRYPLVATIPSIAFGIRVLGVIKD